VDHEPEEGREPNQERRRRTERGSPGERSDALGGDRAGLFVHQDTRSAGWSAHGLSIARAG
jgi:hypothetical protein